ncbi:MAG TPA: phage/plasmid primase, P4 family [Ktedonobacteraceae bacterium]
MNEQQRAQENEPQGIDLVAETPGRAQQPEQEQEPTQSAERSQSESSRAPAFVPSDDEPIALESEARTWEINPWLLGTRRGVIDLRSGSLRGGRPDDSLRTVAPATWKGLEEPAPRFEQFLQEMFADRPERERAELIAFLQRALGYGITGHSKEHIFLMFYGEGGSNGKRTLMHALSHALGKAVGAVPQDILTRGKRTRAHGGTHPRVRALQGKRIAWVSEPGEGTRFATDQIKRLTDGEPLSARRFCAREVTITPSHLLILLGARKPEADPSDHVFWKRVCPIACNMRFVARPEQPDEQLRDPQLTHHLRAEASGILAWLVRGALEWHHVGLAIPRCILQTRKECRFHESTVAGFLRERCLLKAGTQTPASVLYKSYRTWASANGLAALGNQQFARELRQIDGVRWQRSKQGKFYQGITLQG